MVSIRARGFSHERDLVRKMWEHGLAVIRAPASGSKSRRTPCPDIIAIYRGKVIVIEAKSVKKIKNIYIDPHQVEKLLEFARRASGEPYIAIKVVGTGDWTFIPVSKIERTKTGKYKISKELLKEGIKLEALISTIKGVKRLSQFIKEAGES